MGPAGAFTAGVGLTAYTLGLRHALDADHIAAIDNTTRKLMTDGGRPLGVGLFFSLGHSTVVFVLARPARARRAVGGRPGRRLELDAAHDHGRDRAVGVGRVPAAHRRGQRQRARRHRACVPRRPPRERSSEAELAERATVGGPAAACSAAFTRAVTRSWQMYPLGVLFGLGFDTATEIALLFLAGGSGGRRAAVVRGPDAAGAVRRRHVAARHDRRLVHELRLRLGVLEPGAQALLQRHGDGTLRPRRARHRRRSSSPAVLADSLGLRGGLGRPRAAST